MEKKQWYKDKVFYQVWPRSFKDGKLSSLYTYSREDSLPCGISNCIYDDQKNT